jgi:hypothetical protein
MQWESPLKKKTTKAAKPPPPPPTREEIQQKIQKAFKKPKCVISAAQAKKILNSTRSDPMIAQWVERWIDDLVRGYSYPPQLRSGDFYSLLPTYFDQNKVLSILEQIRIDFHNAHPTIDTRPKDDDLAWLPPLLRADAIAMSIMPPGYLDD